MRRRRGGFTEQISNAAARDHDVVSIADLRLCGLSDSGIQNRVQAGQLFRKYPGVYAFGRPDLKPNGYRMAAVKACGPGALVSFASGAALRGMRRSASAYIDITVPAGTPLRKLKGIRCHRADLEPQDISEVDGIPTTSVSRTLLDLATQVSYEGLESAANEAEVLEIFDMREMEDLLARSKGYRGIRRLRQVLEHGDISGENRKESGLEELFARLCAEHGLPKPSINRWLLLGDSYEQVDFLWREEKVVIEVDSNRYHRTGWKLRRDARRDKLLPAHGYLHDRVPEDLLKESPLAAIGMTAALLDQRRCR
ncbi:MAG TPA: type IV toxin-antitoxin system AbiEi family antitoxin domain-containing protein [Solirubrobacterales bacterium]|nr:type IV toxin-antitoxin system AbiEi family antitoxin domain-containing protein [Solirubrobacterales bacterium]